MKSKKEILERGFKSEAERISKRYREKLGLKSHEPMCGFVLAKHLDVKVFIPSDLGINKEEEEKLQLKSGWSAYTSPKNGHQRFILHNNSHSPARQQSNLMHELSHIIRNHELPPAVENLPISMRHFDPVQEAEAEHLGSVLQLPREGLLYHLKKGRSISFIANHFNASESMTNFRINSSGIKRQLSFRK